jgi:hypothetical protein
MFQVRDIFEDARRIFRHCDESLLFERIGDAIELLSIKGEFDPLLGYVDICVIDACVTLPREVEQVLAINLDGRPMLGKNPFHTFHLNGPGDFLPDRFSWTDVGQFPTYRDLQCPGKLVAFLDSEDDAGKELRVFGFDDQNRPLRTKINGVWEDGLIVPTIFGYALPAATDPVVSRITHIVKARTIGDVRLSSFDNAACSANQSASGCLLGIFEPDETIPLYRRIKLGYRAKWARLAYRKRTFRINSLNDRILLHSRLALVLAMRAVQFWHDTDAANATMFEAHAVRILTEKEQSLEGPAMMPIQVQDRNSIKNPGYDDFD